MHRKHPHVSVPMRSSTQRGFNCSTPRSILFATNPLATADPSIWFYAPRLHLEKYPLGTLCVIDRRPRKCGSSPKQVEVLQALSSSKYTTRVTACKLADAARITSELQQVEQERLQLLLASRQHEEECRNSPKPNNRKQLPSNLRPVRAVNSASDGVAITDPNFWITPVLHEPRFL